MQADALLTWFTHNQRRLPWRNDPSPYAVLVSELMLQQTRVDTVLDSRTPTDAVVTGFQSPLGGNGHTVVVIALRNPDRAAEAAGTMFVPAQKRGSVWGTVALLRGGTFRSYDIQVRRYPVGSLPPLLMAVAFFTKNYWLVPFAVLIFALIFASVLEWSLERKARARLLLES